MSCDTNHRGYCFCLQEAYASIVSQMWGGTLQHSMKRWITKVYRWIYNDGNMERIQTFV